MDAQPSMTMPGLRRHRDVDQPAGRDPHSPESACGYVAQHRPGSAGEYRCHPGPALAQLRPAHGVDPFVDSMEPAVCESMSNRRWTQAALRELSVGDDSVLPTTEGPHISRFRLNLRSCHIDVKCSGAANHPRGGYTRCKLFRYRCVREVGRGPLFFRPEPA